MNKLTFGDVDVFLEFLLVTRRVEVDAVTDAAGGARVLDRTRTKLLAVPAEVVGGLTNAEALSEGDGVHDGFGTALWHLGQAYLALPIATPEARAAAQYLLASFIPERRQLGDAFATETARAKGRQPALTDGRAQLDVLPVVGGTSHLWASGFVEAGIALSPLLEGRADAKGSRSAAGVLRLQAIGQINRFRGSVRDALSDTPDQGAAVDKRLFAYLDLLSSMRERGSTEPTPKPPVDAPPAV